MNTQTLITTKYNKHVQQPMQYDQLEYEARCAKKKEVYSLTSTATAHRFDLLQQMIDFLLEQPAGTKQCSKRKPLASPLDYVVWLDKPQTQQEKELEVIYQQVEQDYKAEIEQWNQDQVELLANQLYQAEQKKELKVQEDKEAKAKAKALKDAEEYFKSIQKA